MLYFKLYFTIVDVCVLGLFLAMPLVGMAMSFSGPIFLLQNFREVDTTAKHSDIIILLSSTAFEKLVHFDSLKIFIYVQNISLQHKLGTIWIRWC